MKTILVFGLALASPIILSSCGSTERERKLQAHADSLAIELKSTQEARATLHEVGVLLDAIDKKRAALSVSNADGNSLSNYSARLRSINRYVGKTEAKIARLEKVVKQSTMAKAATIGAIHRLKTELEDANKELVAMRQEEIKLRNDEGEMKTQLSEKDSLIAAREEFIKVKVNELVAKEALAKKIEEESMVDFGNLYYAQANALEAVANHTKLAPRKKKDTRREAIELYEIARSLGNADAEARINTLEKQTGQLSLQHNQSVTSKVGRY